MFNWLANDAKHTINISAGIFLSKICFVLEFYNLKFELFIPLPLDKLIPWFGCHILLFKRFKIGKKYAGVKNRTIETQAGIQDFDIGVGFCFEKFHEPVDHDPITFSVWLGPLWVAITSTHSWHVYDTETGYRFPTDKEARSINRFTKDLEKRMFGDDGIPLFPEDEGERKLRILYWDTVHDFMANLMHINEDGEVWNETENSAENENDG